MIRTSENKITINHIFKDNRNWDRYFLKHRDSIRKVELEEVNKMLSCRDSSRGFLIYHCPDCGEIKTIHFGCNSRVCTHCGTKFNDEWSERIADLTFDVPHRHIVLGTPRMLWPLFKEDRTLLKDLLDCGIRAFHKVLHYFLGRKVKAGAIIALHTYGKDMKWNPHLHSITTDGGFGESGVFVSRGFTCTVPCATAGCTRS